MDDDAVAPTVAPTADRPLRIAVIGAGPAGIYTAEALIKQRDVPVAVDLVDRLPTPFGLVRHGIAPDHPKMRAIRDTLHRTLEHPAVRFVGNVEIGTDLSLEELRRHADAVVYTYGAALDRRLGIDGEDLPGSIAATDLVAWYCGHPDADRERMEQAVARARRVVVIGVGNVALDVARVLARTPADPHPGPAQATFTTQELRELGGMAGATVLVDPADLELDAAAEERATADRTVARNLAALREWVGHVPEADRVRLWLRFFSRPVRLLGDGRVSGIEIERTVVDADGRAGGTGETSVLPADLVVRSVGYRGTPLPGLPVDERTGTVAHEVGRVLRGGQASPGEYVAGWIKRGPTGVVGHNKHDARETVAGLLADAQEGLLRSHGPVGDLVDTLAARGAEPVLLEDWRAIDAAEAALGATRGRSRTTLHEREALLDAVRKAAARVG